jgi:hypothetical protein
MLVIMLQRYISLGDIDVSSDMFLFKPALKSKSGLNLIKKNNI